MPRGTIYVDCPCCSAKLEVDRETGKVVQQWARKDAVAAGGDPLKAAFEKLEADKKRRESFFSNVKGQLEARKREMQEKFDKERERINREGDVSRPPNPFDFD